MESNIVMVLCETLCFSFLVSFLTLGISAASYKGAVLYPFRLWVEKVWAKKRLARLEKLKAYQMSRRSKRQASEWVTPAIDLAEVRLLYRIAIFKVLFMCGQCMPTLWSGVVYWSLFYNEPLHIWIVGWPVSSIINYFITKRYL